MLALVQRVSRAKVTVQNLCISNSSGKISMWGVQGDSMSTLSSVQAS